MNTGGTTVKTNISLVLLLCFLSVPAIAADRYVAPNGVDSPTRDGTINQPWATPWYGACRMQAGETLWLRADPANPGQPYTYHIPNVIPCQDRVPPCQPNNNCEDVALGMEKTDIQIAPPSGSGPAQYTRITAFVGDDITIDASNREWHNTDSPSHGIFLIQGKQYIEISNLKIHHCDNPCDIYAQGILILDSQNIRIINNEISDTWQCWINVGGSHYITIDSNEMTRSSRWEGLQVTCSFITIPAGQSTEGGMVFDSSTNVDVSNNTMNDTKGTDGTNGLGVRNECSDIHIYRNVIYDVFTGQSGIYVISGHDVDIYRNELHDCFRGINVSNENYPDGTKVEHVKIYNNICYNNAVGIVVTPSGAGERPINDVQIINNTVAYNTAGGIDVASKTATAVVVRNNVATYNGPQYVYDPTCNYVGSQIQVDGTCALVDHNLVAGVLGRFQFIDPPTQSDPTGGTQIGNPKFCDAVAGDYHIASGSPSIGKGVKDAFTPVDDFEGYPRDPLNTGHVTIGAYENPSGCSPAPVTLNTSSRYNITVHPTNSAGGTFTGAYNIRLSNYTPGSASMLIPVAATTGDYVVQNQPECWYGTIGVEAPGYYCDPQYLTVLNGGTSTLSFTMIAATPFHGTISSNTTWNGTKLLDGDVRVAAGKTLTITGNTTILMTRSDAANLLNPEMVDLIVDGTVQTTAASPYPAPDATHPIVIKSLNPACTWGGMYLNGQIYAANSSLPAKYVELRDSRYGLTVNTSSGWAINYWTFDNNLERDVSILGSPAATIALSIFDVGTGDGIQVLRNSSASGAITLRDNTFSATDRTLRAIYVNDASNVALSPAIYQNKISGHVGDPTVRTGNGLYFALGKPFVYNNDIRDWENGIYITGGNPLIGNQPYDPPGPPPTIYQGNQISGCTVGINAVCGITNPSKVKYNAIVYNTTGVIATAALSLGTSSELGNNSIDGAVTCVKRADTCDGTTMSAVGNFWPATPGQEPTCKDPNTSQINTGSPRAAAYHDPMCSSCLTPSPRPSMTFTLPPPEVVPERTALMGIHPNPFNPTTTVDFDLKESAWTTISIYNVSGQLVRVESLGTQPAGRHNWVWKGTDQKGASVSSGVYFVVLKAGTVVDKRKAVLLK